MYEVAIFLNTKEKQYAVWFLTLCMKTVIIIKCFSLHSPPFLLF